MAPESVKVPVPVLARVPEPLMMPLIVVLLLRPPLVKVTPEPITILPAPAIEPTVSVVLMLYVAPPATVMAVVSAKVPETVSVPALIVVVPV